MLDLINLVKIELCCHEILAFILDSVIKASPESWCRGLSFWPGSKCEWFNDNPLSLIEIWI